jgi:glutaminyl-tRNA synthetase
MNDSDKPGADFIRQAVGADVAAGTNGGRVQTRFPPEPNGYLHIGHAKAISIDFGVAEDFNGACFLRFDDTNPAREDEEYVDAIIRDIRWLGYDWGDRLRYASDYFSELHDFAVDLIRQGKAYVDSQSADEIRANRGTLTEPGVDSPFRNRPVDENLELFARMRAGEFGDGEHVVRAKIDMAAPNMNLRDPTLYRIRNVPHQRTGRDWCIYPMYDFAHTLSDALEGTTHSLCSLEFEDHRPLYDWLIDQLPVPHRPRQIEFSRFNLMFTITSKRKLKYLVDEGLVDGWDDPRMPTLAAFRRRGFTPTAIRACMAGVGVTKKKTVTELGFLENCIREELNVEAPRRFAVINPLKVVIDNFPENDVEWLAAANHPNRPELGSREVPFTREIYIERDDFMVDPPRKFHRLCPGGEVRLRYGYIVRCESFETNAEGEVDVVHCTLDPATRGGDSGERKVKGTIHWVSAGHAVEAEVRLYDRLFKVPDPAVVEPIEAAINEHSLEVVPTALLEPALADAGDGERFQFERLGYFILDEARSAGGERGERLIFNRIVTLRDSWAKIEQQALEKQQAAATGSAARP